VALNETLRHDYGPARSLDYFVECKKRLDEIQQAIDDSPGMDSATIADRMRSLGALGSRISLIERSHLGEFSWPFSEAIRQIAECLFLEQQLDGTQSPPIVHVIAEGMHYQIVGDVLPSVGDRRIVIVAFPRQLKHHVLLHSIFGHELGHTALYSTGPGRIITTQVMPALSGQGPLQDSAQATAWLKRDDAPPQIRAMLRRQGEYIFPTGDLQNWCIEIICDLFGLMLFGPAFAAAHRAILGTLCDDPWEFDLSRSTHPPYSIRRKILTAAIKELGWHRPVTTPQDGCVHEAELALLDYAAETTDGVTHDRDEAWTSLLYEGRLATVLERLSRIFALHQGTAYSPPERAVVIELLNRLTLCRPPILSSIEDDGTPNNRIVPTCHCLYAGWSFWFGRTALRQAMLKSSPRLPELTFLQVNQLCDFAMRQQCAINAAQRGNK
jgi:hypothetical protein